MRRNRLCGVVVSVLLGAAGAGHATTLEISVNYAHDWVSGVTDPFAAATVMVKDSTGALKATGFVSADGSGYFLVGGGDWSPHAPDIQPGDRVDASVAGATAAVPSIGSIPAELDAVADVVSGAVHAPWLAGPVAVRCAIWETSGPQPIDTTADPNGGGFLCDFGGMWDLQPHDMVAVMYFEADGDRVINVPPWTWMRVDYQADEIGGDYPAAVTFDIAVEDNGGSLKATAQVVSEAGLGWQGDGFFTQPGDWVPNVPDIVPGDVVNFSGGDGYVGQIRVGFIEGTIDPSADLLSGFLNLPWLPGGTMLDVQCHPWGAWALGFDAPIITSLADVDTDPGYSCDWSTTPWNMVDHQPVGVVYFESDGDGVIREFGEPTQGFVFADDFESGDTGMWAVSIP